MKAVVTGIRRSVVRTSLFLAATAASFLIATGVALAGARTPSHGGPGPGADTGGSAAELVAVGIILAVAAAAVLYDASRRSERAAAKKPACHDAGDGAADHCLTTATRPGGAARRGPPHETQPATDWVSSFSDGLVTPPAD
jgi:hypothetical protein